MSDKRKISELIPDHANANKGTERGRYALEASLRQYGAGRSILLDKNGRIIAGNKTVEVAADVGLDDVLIVQTDGKQIVAVQRTDLDIDSVEGRGLAYADNRVGQLSLDWDAEQVLADLNAGMDLSGMWKQDELDELIAGMNGDADYLGVPKDAKPNPRKLPIDVISVGVGVTIRAAFRCVQVGCTGYDLATCRPTARAYVRLPPRQSGIRCNSSTTTSTITTTPIMRRLFGSIFPNTQPCGIL